MQFRVVGSVVRKERFGRCLLRILERTVLCSISTVGPRGSAYVNTAYFAFSPELELYFLSDPRSQHARNLRRNPSTAMTVFDSHQTWGEADRGVQLFGGCAQLGKEGALRAEEAYARRFPRFNRWRDRLAPGAAARRWRFFEFVPSVVKILDERDFKELGFVRATVVR